MSLRNRVVRQLLDKLLTDDIGAKIKKSKHGEGYDIILDGVQIDIANEKIFLIADGFAVLEYEAKFIKEAETVTLEFAEGLLLENAIRIST